MRPAWLPPSTPSPRDAPTSSVADAMVAAAQQHLSDSSPAQVPSAIDEPTTVALRDYMDSFPLVPLAIIPRLSLGDLRECETGLSALLATLPADSEREPENDDDVRLAKYLTRQLTLVQRHLEQARARERVLQLLNGDIPASITPIPARKPTHAVSNSHLSSSSSNNNESNPPSLANNCRSTALLPPHGAGATRPGAPTLAVRAKAKAKALALARATAVPAFAISAAAASSSSSCIVLNGGCRRRRKRGAAPSKKTAEQEEAERANRVEKEREARRQAAYQRLRARQELQEAKKRQQQQKLQPQQRQGDATGLDISGAVQRLPPSGAAEPESASACEPASSGEMVKATDVTVVDGVIGGDDDGAASDSSTESEVSNCSDGDADAEREIMAMPVVVEEVGEREPDAKQNNDVDEECEAEESDEQEEEDAEEEGDAGEEEEEKEEALEMTREGSGVSMVPDLMEMSVDRPEVDSDDNEGTSSSIASDCGALVVGAHAAPTSPSHVAADNDNDGDANTNTLEQLERDSITRELDKFVAKRRAFAIAALAERAASSVATSPRYRSRPAMSTSLSIASSTSSTQPTIVEPPSSDIQAADSVAVANEVSDTKALNKEEHSAVGSTEAAKLGEAKKDPTNALDRDVDPQRARAVVKNAVDVAIPRPPRREIQSYQSYFANFYCILTSVYEQRRAVLAHATTHGSLSNSGSSSSLVATTTAGDHSLRQQLKLYQSWQTIMHDYATVFGNPMQGLSVSASRPHYRINAHSRTEVNEIVVSALERISADAGAPQEEWEEHPSGLGLKTTWNLLWTWSKPRVERQTLLAWQRVNHFHHARALTRKDCLKKNIGRYLAMGGRLRQAYDIAPASFVLPHEYVAFVAAFQARAVTLAAQGHASNKNIWILKPVALSRGRGISLVNELSQVVYSEPVVIQEYIADPLLLDGFKFDLRLYVLVTSFNPLEAFFYEDGFIRMCTRPYAATDDLSDLFVHLTNSSIQKENQNQAELAAVGAGTNPSSPSSGSAANAPDGGGTKLTLDYLWKRVAAVGGDVEAVQTAIRGVILKTLLCGEDHIPFQVNSFDLLGYDVLLDADLRPWLIEINSSPSMARENALDHQVKDALLYDTLRLVNPLRFDRAALVTAISRRADRAELERRSANSGKLPHQQQHPREAEEAATRELNQDLTEILCGEVPRAYGEMPAYMGRYTRLCPHTTLYNQLVKLKKSCLRSRA